MSNPSSEDDEVCTGPFRPDKKKIAHKMARLPTLAGLLSEKDPNAFTEKQLEVAKNVIRFVVAAQPQNDGELTKTLKAAAKKYKSDNKKSLLLAAYKELIQDNEDAPNTTRGGTTMSDMESIASSASCSTGSSHIPIERSLMLEKFLITKAPRSQSGVLVITVFTSAYPDGQKFSCKWNCYYCPNEPGQPRSYLLNEPGVRRANRLDFDAYRQFEDRVQALCQIGHPPDKLEVLVLGGTWESYPASYRERFIRDLFYAANTMFDPQAERRAPMDLLQEQTMNENANKCRIIGVTLETRPDTVNLDMLVKLRQYGCTRVQLGVQHTDESILLAVNRQAFREDTARAIRLLKDSCFKVDIHLMPDLPGTTPSVDKAMFDDVLYSPDLQADQWKIYPCQTTPFTVIKKWYEEGKYKPFSMDELVDVLLYAKRRVHPWIRLNRVIRDIPVEYVLAGIEVANLRQLLEIRMKQEGKTCQCIRCREVKGDPNVAQKLADAVIVERQFSASGGKEWFLSVETPDYQTIFGFLRLRFPGPEAETPFEELRGAALIRELHVYGNLTTVGERGERAQHMGIGSALLQRAEELALEAGFGRIAVISGVGVREYYRKRGYTLIDAHRGAFLLKQLDQDAAVTDSLQRIAPPQQFDSEMEGLSLRERSNLRFSSYHSCNHGSSQGRTRQIAVVMWVLFMGYFVGTVLMETLWNVFYASQ